MEDFRQSILFEDYKLRVQYLVDQYARMWNRFNYFLTLHTAISAGLFTLIVSDKPVAKPICITIAVMGLVFAISWYAFGAQDRYLVELYSRQVIYIQHQVEALKDQPSIGSVDDIEKFVGRIPRRIYQWRIRNVSVTRLAAWFPLVMLAYWLILLSLALKEASAH